jgi:hypothetical protein
MARLGLDGMSRAEELDVAKTIQLCDALREVVGADPPEV